MFSRVSKGSSIGIGSTSVTLIAAPAIRPDFNALYNAFWSTTCPRDVFTKMAVGLIMANYTKARSQRGEQPPYRYRTWWNASEERAPSPPPLPRPGASEEDWKCHIVLIEEWEDGLKEDEFRPIHLQPRRKRPAGMQLAPCPCVCGLA